MELIHAPHAPYHMIATFSAALVGLLMTAALLVPARRALLGRTWPARGLVAAYSVAAAALLAWAIWNPIWEREAQPEPIHLAVVLDLSPSMTRPTGSWERTRVEIGDLLAQLIADLPDAIREEGSASLIAFRNDAAPIQPPPASLADLADRVRGLGADAIGGDGSDLATGLDRARRQVLAAGGRGAVLLVSDGLETEGDAQKAAEELAAAGIPVYVYPVPSVGAEVALLSADLPRQTYAGDPLRLRATLWNTRPADTPVEFQLSVNTGLTTSSPRLGVAGETPIVTMTVEAEDVLPLRSAITFEGGHGLQFLDLTMRFDEGRGEQRRRFYTHVKRPLRLLAIGGDQGWQAAFPEGAAEITALAAGDLAAAGDLRGYDVMVISAVAAQDFADGELAQIAEAVERDGVGLMLINGDHAGSSDEANTIIRSYDGTPLEPILPLKSGPRPFEAEPPSRHIIFLIDTSGSMSGWPLEKAKEIVADVIERLLRPIDTIDIIAFTCDALHIVKNQAMDPAGKRDAISKLATLQSGGSTCIEGALQLITNEQYDDCGLIYVTDGEFGAVSLRPDCRATAFAIGGNITPALSQLADPFPVDPSFNPSTISIPYFEPEQRKRLWESGSFSPLSLATVARLQAPPPIPAVALPGSAIAYPRDRSTELVAIRPKLRDPVLAYRPTGSGYVGMFTSGFPPEWLQSDESLRAVEEWISRLAPYSARERYHFQLHDDGGRMDLQLSLIAEGDRLPDVQSVQMQVQIGTETPTELAVVGDADAPATFNTTINLPRMAEAQEATLIITERGPDALPRPQRIPLIIPPQGMMSQSVTTEAYSFGTNTALLTTIADTTGGRQLPLTAGEPLFRVSDTERERLALWPALIALAACCYWIAILLRRLGR